MNADSFFTSGFLIAPQKNKRGFSIRTLPSLPQTIDNASATAINNVIYLTGGNQQHKGKSLFRFNLNSGTGWETLPSYPGPQRTQPILVNDRRHLYLAGGFQAPTKETESILSDDILCFNTERNQWEYFSEIPNEEDGEKRCWLEEQAHKRPPISSLPEELITPFSKTLSKEKPIKITCAKIRCGINSTMMFCSLISNRKNGQFTPIHSEWPSQEAYFFIPTTACLLFV